MLTNAASQAEIDEAAKSLREARLNARTKADVSALEELIAYANSLDLHAYTSASVAAMNVPYTKALVMIENEEVTQEQVDELAEEMQAAIDALEPVNANATTPDAGSANDSSNSTTAESTNTAAANMSGMMIALMAAASAAARRSQLIAESEAERSDICLDKTKAQQEKHRCALILIY